MEITILDSKDHSAIELLIEEPEFFPDICRFYILGELDPGQVFVRATMKDEIGQEGLAPDFSVCDAWIKMTEDYNNFITISDLEDHLEQTTFYSDVIAKIKEGV